MLETHWNGALLDTIEAVVEVAGTMRWKGQRPVVTPVTAPYAKGVNLTEAAMVEVEAQLRRRPGLEQYCVDIVPALAGGPG